MEDWVYLGGVFDYKAKSSNGKVYSERGFRFIENFSNDLSAFSDEFDIDLMKENCNALPFYWAKSAGELHNMISKINNMAMGDEDGDSQPNELFKYENPDKLNPNNPYANHSIFMVAIPAKSFERHLNSDKDTRLIVGSSKTLDNFEGTVVNECLISKFFFDYFKKFKMPIAFGEKSLANYLGVHQPREKLEGIIANYYNNNPDVFFGKRGNGNSGNNSGGYGDGM